MEDTVPTLRIVTTSAVFLTLAAGSASAQLPGTRFATFEQAAEIHRDVDLRRVES